MGQGFSVSHPLVAVTPADSALCAGPAQPSLGFISESASGIAVLT